MNVLFAWLGQADLNGAGLGDRPASTPGPVCRALKRRAFGRLVLLSNYEEEKSRRYGRWLATETEPDIRVELCALSDPTAFDEIYRAAETVVGVAREQLGPDAQFTYHLSPGTPAMAVVWIILANSKHPAGLLEASTQTEVRDVHFPFALAAEFAPRTQPLDSTILTVAAGVPPRHPSFHDIVGSSPVMQQVMWRAEQLARRQIPVLIEGESGTGKELLARAIHGASDAAAKPLVAVNCGAIPGELLESELFGHEKGAFTGAVRRHRGCFERAHGSTLFLDEIGELPLDAQVRLLRALQEKEITPLGSEDDIPVDVRVVAATNRSLAREVRAGRFREDLFYRLAVGVLTLPPIRERPGDLTLLIDSCLDRVNAQLQVPGYTPPTLSVQARRALLAHSWPGNVRELQNVLLRAALWTTTPQLSKDDIRSALQAGSAPRESILDRPLGDGFRLADVVAEVYRHYLTRGLVEAGRKKNAATRLLGISNYQTFSNFCRKYGVSVASPGTT